MEFGGLIVSPEPEVVIPPMLWLLILLLMPLFALLSTLRLLLPY